MARIELADKVIDSAGEIPAVNVCYTLATHCRQLASFNLTRRKV